MGIITKAVRIDNANQIADGVITGAKLANDTITANKIAILDYVRSLQYDVYNDAKTDVKARLEHAELSNNVNFMAGADVASLDSVFHIASQPWSSEFIFGQKVSVVDMNLKRLGNLGSPVVAGDALRFGAAEITNNEISPTANIAKSKLAIGATQRVSGVVTTTGIGYHDITGLITPSSYPALAIGYAGFNSIFSADDSSLVLRNQVNVDLTSNLHAFIDDSSVREFIARGSTNIVSITITSGSVKLSHYQNTNQPGRSISGILIVIEL